MKQSGSRKALVFMVGTLILLLIVAVVMLSIIIVSLVSERTNPVENTTASYSAKTTASAKKESDKSPATQGAPTTSTEVTTAKSPVTSANITDSHKTDGGSETTEKSSATTTKTAPETSRKTSDKRYPGEVYQTSTVENEDGTITKKGSFLGESDVRNFRLLVEWEAKYAGKGATSVQLTVRVYVKSHSLRVGARPGGMLSVGGVEASFTSPAIYYDDDDIHLTQVYSRTMTLSKNSAAAKDIDIDAAWYFGGTYSDIDIEFLTASGTIEI